MYVASMPLRSTSILQVSLKFRLGCRTSADMLKRHARQRRPVNTSLPIRNADPSATIAVRGASKSESEKLKASNQECIDRSHVALLVMDDALPPTTVFTPLLSTCPSVEWVQVMTKEFCQGRKSAHLNVIRD